MSAVPPLAIGTLAAYVASWPPGLGRSGRKLQITGIAHGHALAGMPFPRRGSTPIAIASCV